MTVRKPLILLNGIPAELPAADSIPTSSTSHEVGARIRNSAVQSIPNATATIVTFGTTRRANNVTVASDKLTADEAGWYYIGVEGEFVANATGIRLLQLKLNAAGTLIVSQLVANAGGTFPTRLICATCYYLAAGDYVQAEAYQDSGGALNLNFTQAYTTEFWMVKLGAVL